jgi:hypothetical protein
MKAVKWISISVALATALAFAACGSKDKGANTMPSGDGTGTEPVGTDTSGTMGGEVVYDASPMPMDDAAMGGGTTTTP